MAYCNREELVAKKLKFGFLKGGFIQGPVVHIPKDLGPPPLTGKPKIAGFLWKVKGFKDGFSLNFLNIQ